MQTVSGQSPTETPPQEAEPAPEQRAETTEATEPTETKGEGETQETPAKEPDEIDALLSLLKGETAPKTEEKPKETPDSELPWHKRISDEELAGLRGQIKINEDGTVDMPVLVIDKEGNHHSHIKRFQSVEEALAKQVTAPLDIKRAKLDAEHIQQQLQKLRETPVSAPEAPGSVIEPTKPVIADLAFSADGKAETQGTLTTAPTGAPTAPTISLEQRLWQDAQQIEMKAIEPRVYEMFRKEREAEIREQRGLDAEEPVTLTTRDKTAIKKDVKEYLAEETKESEEFQQRVQNRVLQQQANINRCIQFEEAQAQNILGEKAKDFLEPFQQYRSRVEMLGQSPRTEDEIALHRIMTSGVNGAPNYTLLASTVLNHLALRRALPDIQAVARTEGEKAMLEKIEQYRTSRPARKPVSNQPIQQQSVESRTGSQTAPPGFSDRTPQPSGFAQYLAGTETDRPAWMTPGG
jgi:hypothetical protein